MSKKSDQIDLVDRLLEGFFTWQEEHTGLPRSDYSTQRAPGSKHMKMIADKIGVKCTRKEISTALQVYRQAQFAGANPDWVAPRYHIAANKYARGSRWSVIAGPGLNKKRTEEMRMGQLKWVLKDATCRLVKDFHCEILPTIDLASPAVRKLVRRTAMDIISMMNLSGQRLVEDVGDLAGTKRLSDEDIEDVVDAILEDLVYS